MHIGIFFFSFLFFLSAVAIYLFQTQFSGPNPQLENAVRNDYDLGKVIFPPWALVFPTISQSWCQTSFTAAWSCVRSTNEALAVWRGPIQLLREGQRLRRTVSAPMEATWGHWGWVRGVGIVGLLLPRDSVMERKAVEWEVTGIVFSHLCPSSLPDSETGEDPRYSLGARLEVGSNKGKGLGEFPGGRAVRTSCSQCRGHGLDPWPGN